VKGEVIVDTNKAECNLAEAVLMNVFMDAMEVGKLSREDADRMLGHCEDALHRLIRYLNKEREMSVDKDKRCQFCDVASVEGPVTPLQSRALIHAVINNAVGCGHIEESAASKLLFKLWHILDVMDVT